MDSEVNISLHLATTQNRWGLTDCVSFTDFPFARSTIETTVESESRSISRQ